MYVLSDILALQTDSSRNRGIGRYTAKALEALLTSSETDIQHIFLANGHLERPDALTELQSNAFRLFYGDYPLFKYRSNTWSSQESGYAKYWQRQIAQFAPDVLHVHSAFEWDSAPPHSKLDGVATVVTVYDLIPIKMEEHYLRDASSWLKSYYQRVCRWLSQVDHVVTISEFSRTDIVELLGVSPDRVTIAMPGPSDTLRSPYDHKVAASVRRRFGLPDGFVLCNSGVDYRKNLFGTLEAYSRLRPQLRDDFPLVLVCAMRGEQQGLLREMAASLGISEQLVLTNYVSDAELAALYHMATVQFFPSLYEGFGLPVLDSMACGLPVITSNTSSLIEVAGDAALLVDPLCIDEISGALTRALESSDLRATLRERGLARAAEFTWEKTAQGIVSAYEAAAASNTGPHRSRRARVPQALRRLALVSPLPPQLTGVTDFSAHLLKTLREHVEVTAYTDSKELAEAHKRVDAPIQSIEMLPQHAEAGQVDAVLYQVGNSPFHRFQLPYLPLVPGIVEIHDGILQGLIYNNTASEHDPEAYLSELSYAHAKAGREHAEQVLAGAAEMPEALFSLPANRRVVNDALGIITHNRWTADLIAAEMLNTPVQVIPLPRERSESADILQPQTARASLGIPPNKIVIGTFGRLAFSKRLTVLLRAFARLRYDVPEAVLLLVGKLDAPAPGFDIPRLINSLDIGEAVTITGYVDGPRFVEYMSATSIAVNLRYPHAGESSATLIQLLNAGIPTIVSNLGPFMELPDDCCWKVDVDSSEEDLLYAYLRRLCTDKELRARMSTNATMYAQRTIPTWDNVAQTFLQFIEKAVAEQTRYYADERL